MGIERDGEKKSDHSDIGTQSDMSQEYQEQCKWLLSNIDKILKLCGEKGICRGCGEEIFWMRHRNGKSAPYTIKGLNHFADCPKAKDFKK